MTPRLARVSSIAAPIGGLDGEPEQAADRSYHSDISLAPMLLGNQEDIEIRANRAAHVGREEIDRIERERIEALVFGFRFHRRSHSVPIARVMIGAPPPK
jgi:hypothetical protein